MNTLVKLKLCLLFCAFFLICTAVTGSISNATNQPETSTGAGADPRDELIKAMRTMLGARSYRSRTTSSSSSGITSTTMLEFVAPDRFHLSRETQSQRGTLKQETIIIGNDSWMKTGGASWQTFPMDLGNLIAQLRNPKVVDELAHATEVKFIGTDTLEGTPAMVYQFTLDERDGKGFKNTTRTWVSVADGLPLKTEANVEMSIAGKTTHIKATTTYLDYGADIKLQPPI